MLQQKKKKKSREGGRGRDGDLIFTFKANLKKLQINFQLPSTKKKKKMCTKEIIHQPTHFPAISCDIVVPISPSAEGFGGGGWGVGERVMVTTSSASAR